MLAYGVAIATVSAASRWVLEIAVAFDVSSDAVLALLFAGLIGPKGDREADLAELGRIAAERRERQIFEKLTAAARSTAGPAVALAALFVTPNPD